MLRIATMGKKATLTYILLLTLDFLVALGFMITGLIFLIPEQDPPKFAIPFTIVGAVLLFVMVVAIMLTTLSSNYVEKKMTEEEKQAIREKYHFKD